MPTAKELTIRLEDRPGTLGKVCRALADHRVNIVAFQSVRSEGKGLVRFVVDDPARAKKALDNEGLSYQETDIAQTKLSHRPGELARAASRLGEANINIGYAYCGVDPNTYTPLVILASQKLGKRLRFWTGHRLLPRLDLHRVRPRSDTVYGLHYYRSEIR